MRRQEKSPDPVTVEIIRNVLIASCEEMKATIVRTAHSPIIYEVLDFSTGLFNSKGELAAQTAGLAIFLGTLSFATKEVIDKYGIRGLKEGDIVMTNDPYRGTHLNDVVLISPVYYDGDVVGLTAAKTHWIDIGGKDPGSYTPNAVEVFQEGLFLPAVKLLKEGEPNQDLIETIAANSRLPDMVIGDMYANVAACRIGENRVKEICRKYGSEVFLSSVDQILDSGERATRAAIKNIPEGEYFGEQFLDDCGTTPDPVRIQCKVIVKGTDIKIDFAGSDRQVPGPYNAGIGTTVSACRIMVKAATDPKLPTNEGCFRPLEVFAPVGSVVNARPPAPTSLYLEAAAGIWDAVWKALAPVIPHKIPAGHYSSACGVVISGVDPRNGRYFIMPTPEFGGWGGGLNKDGESALITLLDGDTYNMPVEVVETLYPLHIEQYSLNEGSGGAGKYRGGLGSIKDYRPLCDELELTVYFERHKFPPFGVLKGRPGAPNSVVINPDSDEPLILGKAARKKLTGHNTVVRAITGGGGGFGDPLERDPELVREDVHHGYISPEAAESEYGVVLDKNTLRVAMDNTRQLRAALAHNNRSGSE